MQSERKYRLGKTVLNESDLKISIVYKEDTFVLLYPTPVKKTMIENEIARRLNGYARTSFSTDHLSLVEACATIDVVMVKEECPDWYEGPWTCVDEKLIAELFAGYFQFRDNFRQKLHGGELEGSSE